MVAVIELDLAASGAADRAEVGVWWVGVVLGVPADGKARTENKIVTGLGAGVL